MKNVLVAILLIYSFSAEAFDFDCEVTAVKKSSVKLIGRSGRTLYKSKDSTGTYANHSLHFDGSSFYINAYRAGRSHLRHNVFKGKFSRDYLETNHSYLGAVFEGERFDIVSNRFTLKQLESGSWVGKSKIRVKEISDSSNGGIKTVYKEYEKATYICDYKI